MSSLLGWLGLSRSIRARLLLALSVSLAAFLGLDIWTSYRASLETAQFAYDRMLVTSAHAIADLIRLERGKLLIGLPHAALEIYSAPQNENEQSVRGQMLYRVGFHDGEYLAGDNDLKPFTAKPNAHPIYQSMIELYDSVEGSEPMRVAALLQPVESYDGTRLVVVQVAEPSRPRRAMAQRILSETLARGGAMLLVSLVIMWLIISVALRPLVHLSRRLEERQAEDLSPLHYSPSSAELSPLVAGFNRVLERLKKAQEQQRRFIADASHQLRTPLAVLQLDASAGLAGDIPAHEALQAVANTSRRATRLAEQLLSLARAQQSAANEIKESVNLESVASDVAVELSPLMAKKSLDFQFAAVKVTVKSHGWMVTEILSNLLKNAIEFTPDGGSLGMTIAVVNARAELVVWDSGPGISKSMQELVFKPFATDRPTRGAGLGLAICADLAKSANAEISVENRQCEEGHGLVATVRFKDEVPS